MIKTIIMSGTYMDSTFLMSVSKQVNGIEGVRKAVAVMGTDMNKTVLKDFGALNEETEKTGGNDLIIAVDADESVEAEAIKDFVKEIVDKKNNPPKGEAQEKTFPSLDALLESGEKPNLAIISIPGEYAAAEALNALENGMHVFIFSDNVPLEDALEKKKLGREKNQLVIGPGPRTSDIDNVSIGLMSKVRKGSIGIVAASGSGLQEVAVLAHQFGHGISQAIGTGGRDLSEQVGGSTMLHGLSLLEEDEETKVIVLVSKPPHPKTASKIYAEVKKSKKPVVIFFLGGNADEVRASGAYFALTLEEAARMAVDLDDGKTPVIENCVEKYKSELMPLAAEERELFIGEKKYLRGVFCGGTHSEEAVTLLQDFVPNMHSNISFGKVDLLENSNFSLENTLVDMGDEEFTKGKPHPVMDPSILNDRLIQESEDKDVGVILFDLILGTSAVHPDPVGTIEETLRTIKEKAKAENRHICMVASICGTDIDPQGLENQTRRLENIGVNVLLSNCKAALFAGLVVAGGK